MDCPDFFVLERFGGAVGFKRVAVQAAYASVSAYPNIATAVLEKRSRAEVSESVAHLVIDNVLRTPAAYSFICRNPDAAAPALQEGADEIVDQALLHRVMDEPLADLPIRTLAFGPNPQRAIFVTEYIPNP